MSTQRERHSDRACPAARRAELVIDVVGDETLVYDQRLHHIHQLNAVTAAVWRMCDGRRTIDSIARDVTLEIGESVDAGMARLALTKLGDADLLVGSLDRDLREDGQSRRAFLRRAAVAGGVAIPAIVSVSAPTAAQSDSVPCIPDGQEPGLGDICCSNEMCLDECGACTCGGGCPPGCTCSSLNDCLCPG